jgi:hypothetical protein
VSGQASPCAAGSGLAAEIALVFGDKRAAVLNRGYEKIVHIENAKLFG